MMEIQDLVNLLMNSGVTIVVLAYFIYRDYKFLSRLDTTLQTLVDTVDTLKQAITNRRN